MDKYWRKKVRDPFVILLLVSSLLFFYNLAILVEVDGPTQETATTTDMDPTLELSMIKF